LRQRLAIESLKSLVMKREADDETADARPAEDQGKAPLAG
jgi:hypothetical protein